MPSIISIEGSICATTINAQNPRNIHTRSPEWSTLPTVEAIAGVTLTRLKIIATIAFFIFLLLYDKIVIICPDTIAVTMPTLE